VKSETFDAVFGMRDIRKSQLPKQFDSDFGIEGLTISLNPCRKTRYLIHQSQS